MEYWRASAVPEEHNCTYDRGLLTLRLGAAGPVAQAGGERGCSRRKGARSAQQQHEPGRRRGGEREVSARGPGDELLCLSIF